MTSNFSKYTDPEFVSAQPLSYLPLNLVIDDWDYYHNETLSKFPYPYLYALYIGWIPVLLAVTGLSMGKSKDKRFLWFLATGILFEFLIGSAVLLKWLVKVFPAVAGVRHPPQIAGLAVPLILGLSAYGLEQLLSLDRPKLSVSFPERAVFKKSVFSLKWLLFLFLFLSLQSGYKFTKHWFITEKQNVILPMLEELETKSLAWVEPPFGEHYFIEPSIRLGLKLSPGVMTWRWKEREEPIPELVITDSDPSSSSLELMRVFSEHHSIYIRYDQPYAAVSNNEKPCEAYGAGGSIDVFCTTSSPGQLIVKENMWTGWYAWMDGERVPLLGDHWLEADAPAGKHVYEFRYRPWDVPLGMSLSLVGVFLCVRMWFKSGDREDEDIDYMP
ncbi:MAG: hypothetical protein HN965_06280 [Anaerolineae bacterium]|nr:hypothetical protein [Anaerolineae bacterium]